MSIDIRSILDVYPDHSSFTCVGITQKGVRCKNSWISGSDLSYASRMLDEMSSQEKLSVSIKDLESLAELTLCPRWHRKPGYSQVRSVSRQWQAEIAAYKIQTERQSEKSAMMNSERGSNQRKKTLEDTKVKHEDEEAHENFTTATLERFKFRPQYSSTRSLKTAQETSYPPRLSHHTRFRVSTGNSAVKTEPTTTSSLPSPPASPLTSEQPTPYGIKQEQSTSLPPTTEPATSKPQNLTVTRTSTVKVIAKAESIDLPPKTITREKMKTETLNFEFPPTPDATPPPKQGDKSTGTNKALNLAYEFGAGKQVPPPAFDLSITTKPPTFMPVAHDQSYARDESKRVKISNGIAAFTFQPVYKVPSKSFEFATPTKLSYAMRLPEQPSTIWDDYLNAPLEEKPGLEDPLTLKERSEKAPQAPKTPVKTNAVYSNLAPVTPEATPEPTHDPLDEEAESHGYAIVSPLPMRYKSYLPSHRKHGLITPPETPEEKGYGNQDPFMSLKSSPSPVIAITRKPLPSTPKPMPRDGAAGPCAACRLEEDQCHCEVASEMECGRAGCFHSMRLGRLRKRIARKVNAVRKRIAGTMFRASGSNQE